MSIDDRQLNLPKRAAPLRGAPAPTRAGRGESLALPEREEKILEFWERDQIFQKTLAKSRRGKPFVFYEGPPTANGNPGIHHFEARAFKDAIPRYKTMRGFFVERKAGWDTHGLPVELQVEKALGFTKKQDIERYGIAKFNAKCREAVWKYKEEWDRFTKRMGFWLDLEHPYITYETSYIETLWWIIKEIWKRGFFYRDFKVVPWCPRCETGLSTHELGLGYKTVKDKSVYVKFRIKSNDPKWNNTYILSWTTTPWTLPGNVALAINPEASYVRVRIKFPAVPVGEKPYFVVLERHRQEEWAKSASGFFPPYSEFKGEELVGLEYEPLFAVSKLYSKASHRVYAADFVTMEEGTGVVHTAVMYGVDDYELGKKAGLPAFHTVTETGYFTKDVPEGLAGLYVKDSRTEEKIIASLKRRGLLFREELYEHEYPFCWRCGTHVLYYARYAWWIKMSELRKDLVKNNESINWIPEYIKQGRFGEFLKDARDWAFSRERYWGTPLPVWQCEKCRHDEVIGSVDELSRLAGNSANKYVAMRHGQSETQLLGIADDDKKSFHLTPSGKKQVESAAKKLVKEKFDFVVASPVLRTQETAKIVAQVLGGVEVITDDRLREIHIGVFERRPVGLYHGFYSSDIEKFAKRVPEGECLNDLKARAAGLMNDLEKKYRGKKILLISHEYLIWILSGVAGGFSDEEMVRAKNAKKGDFVKLAEAEELNWRILPRDEKGEVNLHRPFVDFLRLPCPKCSSPMKRVPEVADVWFDSGAMPFAQANFPFAFVQNQKSKIKNQNFGERDIALAFKKLPYPADYISEAIDQTRGWFYTLLAVSTVLGRGASYKNVISLGHVLDKNGQKMSKSKGNVVNPWEMIDRYGTDAIRWYFYTINAPGDPKKFDEKDLQLKLRGALSTFWNSFALFNTYVDKIPNSKSQITNKFKIPRPRPGSAEGGQNSKHVLDVWVVARIEDLTAEVTKRLDDYDIVGAARVLDEFIVEDFSNWYLRRSRRRFQKPETKKEKDDAAAVTAHVLVRLTELMAPFTPFLAEVIYRELKGKLGLKEESVHLRRWPAEKLKVKSLKFKVLMDEMNEVRKIAAAALAERAKAGIKVRQPLAKLKVKSLKLKVAGLLELVKDEVNVKEVVADPSIAGDVELDMHITPELREEGLMRELVRNIQEMRRDAGMKPQQSALLQVAGSTELTATIERWRKFIEKEASVKKIQFGEMKNFMVEHEVVLDGAKAWLRIKKA